MYLVKATKTLRVSREGELEGLDIHEHGGPAYHWEFGSSGYSTPPTDSTSVGAGAKVPDSVS